jgi:hypothetical protein
MPISSKRTSNHHQQQSVAQDKGYDDYVYYPYYYKTVSNGGYEYVEKPGQYEEQSTKYYQTRSTNNSASVHRT